MTVDRSLYAPGFYNFPDWQCPTCGKGHLKVGKELLNKETGPSSAMHDENGWDPEWIVSRFAGLLTCDFGNCGELVAIAGHSFISETYDYDENGEPQQEYLDYFKPLFLTPAPLPIRPPIDAPELVQNALREAAGLLWQSSEGAANQIRQAVEYLMDDQGMAQAVPPKFINLDTRIKEFQVKDPKNAELLLAVKWLGNSGSHAGGLTRNDLLDAFDLIELVLINLYDTTTAILIAKAQAINLHKGPVKPAP